MRWNPFRKPPAPPETGKWIHPGAQWAVGDKCCRIGGQNTTGNEPPRDIVLIVSNVYEGTLNGTNNRTVGLHFSNWPEPVNSEFGGWNASAFRKVTDAKQAEETSIGEKILNAKPAPDRKRKVSA